MIVITGASSGLGAAISTHFHTSGVEVIGVARKEFAADFETVSLDVGDSEAVREFAGQLKRRRIAMNGLVNAAGIASMNLAIMTPSASVEAIMRTNLLGTIFMCQSLSPLIMRAGGGTVVNFSTIAVALGLEGESVYVASKAGVEGFTRAFAREVADHGIRVNCVAPGPIDTALIRGVSQRQREAIVNRQVIRKMHTVEDVTDVVASLFDRRLESISGQVISVGGA